MPNLENQTGQIGQMGTPPLRRANSEPQDARATVAPGKAEYRATAREFARILVSLFICEAAIMITVHVLGVPTAWAIILDPILLTVLGTPVLYWLLIKPFRSSLRQRNHAVAALRKEKEKVQMYLGIAGVILIVIDNKGTITRINRKGIDTLGCSEDEILCRNWFDEFIPSDDRERVKGCFEEMMARNTAELESFENRILRKDGQERIIAWHNRVLRDGTGTATGTLSSGEDITDRRRMEDDLRRYRERLEDLVKVRTEELTKVNRELLDEMTQRDVMEKELLRIIERERQRAGQELHDSIGQQLTGVAFMIETLGEMLSKKSLDEEVSYIERIGARISQAIEQTHTLAKGLHPVGLDKDGLTAALRELAAGTKQLFGVSCVLKCEQEIPVENVSAAINLYRIAQEAITNAVKHGKARNIEISLSRDDGYITLDITNDGTDFPGRESHDGGMGLMIMRYRAETINGSFHIKKNTDGGTIATCILPECRLI